MPIFKGKALEEKYYLPAGIPVRSSYLPVEGSIPGIQKPCTDI